MAQWHFTSGGLQSGPIDDAELKQLVAKGELLPTDMIWKEGMPDWIPAGRLTQLFRPAPSHLAATHAPARTVKPTAVVSAPVSKPVSVSAAVSVGPAIAPAPTELYKCCQCAEMFELTQVYDAGGGKSICVECYNAAQRQPAPTQQPSAPALAANHGGFYYAQGGTTIGPLTEAVLVSLARNGTLTSSDMVWREDSQFAGPAAQTPALAAIFTDSAQRGNRLEYQNKKSTLHAGKILGSARQTAKSVGIILGILILICVNLPIRSEFGGSVYWWNLLNASDGSELFVGCLYALLSGIALLLLWLSGSPVLRGVVFMALWSIPVLAGIAKTAQVDIRTAIITFFPPTAAAALIGTSAFRMLVPQSSAGRVVQQIAGGCLLAGLVVLAWMIIEFLRTAAGGPSPFQPRGSQASSDPFSIFLVILLIAWVLSALGAGVMALLPRTSVGRARAVMIMSIGYFAMPCIMILAIWMKIGQQTPLPSTVVGPVVRIAVVYYSYLGAFALGMNQLLLGQHFGAQARHRVAAE